MRCGQFEEIVCFYFGHWVTFGRYCWRWHCVIQTRSRFLVTHFHVLEIEKSHFFRETPKMQTSLPLTNLELDFGLLLLNDFL